MPTDTLARKIIALKDADLALRDQLIAAGTLSDGYHPAMQSLHDENAAALAAIIDSIGYPTIDKVGEAAHAAAWLVIQHAIGQPAFMRRCHALLERAVAAGAAHPHHLAYLTDRIAWLGDQPQRYGTQFDWDEHGRLSPTPYDNLEKVEARRASIGLNSLAAQTALIRTRAAAENQQPPADRHRRQRTYDAWRKKVGWIE